jgi:hypothetical protein
MMHGSNRRKCAAMILTCERCWNILCRRKRLVIFNSIVGDLVHFVPVK